jgi:putative flippase GtrA
MPLFRFLLVGGAAFLLDASVVLVMTQMGVSAYMSRIVSLAMSVIFTFVLNRQATFSAQGQATWREFLAYVGASSIGIAINYALFSGCLKLGLAWLPAMVIGTVIASAFNFFAYGRIFKKN